jgi:hypothetical protein
LQFTNLLLLLVYLSLNLLSCSHSRAIIT